MDQLLQEFVDSYKAAAITERHRNEAFRDLREAWVATNVIRFGTDLVIGAEGFARDPGCDDRGYEILSAEEWLQAMNADLQEFTRINNPLSGPARRVTAALRSVVTE